MKFVDDDDDERRSRKLGNTNTKPSYIELRNRDSYNLENCAPEYKTHAL